MTVRIHLGISASDGDPDLLERATAALRAELLELDVEDVVPVTAGQAPPGSRALDVAEIGSLLVTAAQVPVVLLQLVDAVRDWVGRDRGEHTVELVIAGDKLLVTKVEDAEQKRLIDVWLRAHALDQSAQD
jgi:hypothetical protein